MNLDGKRVIISRTDSIGDVMLTLPMCHWLKTQFPECCIVFLGRNYTRSVAESYNAVDLFEDWGDYDSFSKTEKVKKLRALNADVIIHVFPNKEIASLAKKAGIGVRIGTSHRLFHLLTCTHRVDFSRRKSDLHESQLNFELLRPVGLTEIPSFGEVIRATEEFKPEKEKLPEPFESLKDYVILHPKSQGSALEWPVERYMDLALRLADNQRNVVFTGTEKEGLLFRSLIPDNTRIYDSTGQLSLPQLITLIGKADGLVACSTGPLHIAGFSGIRTVGLFSPKRPIHPGRWKALGTDVVILQDTDAPLGDKGEEYNYIEAISVEQVFSAITG